MQKHLSGRRKTQQEPPQSVRRRGENTRHHGYWRWFAQPPFIGKKVNSIGSPSVFDRCEPDKPQKHFTDSGRNARVVSHPWVSDSGNKREPLPKIQGYWSIFTKKTMKHTIYAIILRQFWHPRWTRQRWWIWPSPGKRPSQYFLRLLRMETLCCERQDLRWFSSDCGHFGGMPANSTAETDTIFLSKERQLYHQSLCFTKRWQRYGECGQKVEVVENAAPKLYR